MAILPLECLFWISFCLVFYVYLGFPACLFVLSANRRTRQRSELRDDELPTISFIVAAYNEERVIEEKLRNCLRLDYPSGKLKFVFVSDSTDRTNQILLQYQNEQVKVVILPERRGKVAALESAYPLCNGEVLVFSDANTLYRPNSLRMLVRHFVDPEVGVVTGDVRLLPASQTFGQGEHLYYRYERRLQEMESVFHSTVAIDGAMYALRRELLRPVSSGLIADDFVTAMNVALQGYRILYDPEAIAEEDPTPDDGMEFRRKIRIVAYAMQSFLAGEGVPSLRQPRLWWTYVSHKLLRWWVPFFAVLMFLASGTLAWWSPWWRWMVLLQSSFYLAAILTWILPWLPGYPFRIPYYFCMVNLAALRGVLRAVRGGQRPVWVRTERSVTTGA